MYRYLPNTITSAQPGLRTFSVVLADAQAQRLRQVLVLHHVVQVIVELKFSLLTLCCLWDRIASCRLLSGWTSHQHLLYLLLCIFQHNEENLSSFSATSFWNQDFDIWLQYIHRSWDGLSNELFAIRMDAIQLRTELPEIYNRSFIVKQKREHTKISALRPRRFAKHGNFLNEHLAIE